MGVVHAGLHGHPALAQQPLEHEPVWQQGLPHQHCPDGGVCGPAECGWQASPQRLQGRDALTSTHTCIHICTHTYAGLHSQQCSYLYSCILTPILIYTHTCLHIYTHTCTHLHPHLRSHLYSNMCTPTLSHTHSHLHSHAQAQCTGHVVVSCPGCSLP